MPEQRSQLLSFRISTLKVLKLFYLFSFVRNDRNCGRCKNTRKLKKMLILNILVILSLRLYFSRHPAAKQFSPLSQGSFSNAEFPVRKQLLFLPCSKR